MKRYENVKSTTAPESIVFDELSVWVNTNVREEAVSEDGVTYTQYVFDQLRYTKDEYVKLISDRNAELEAQLTDTQLALCELYESIGG